MKTILKKVLILVIIMTFTLPFISEAQIIGTGAVGRSWGSRPSEISSQKSQSSTNQLVKIVKSHRTSSWTEETAYYSDIQRDSLWIVGVGQPLSPKAAAKLTKVFRLSKKLPNGKFIHVESLGQNLQPAPSQKLSSLLLPAERYDYALVNSKNESKVETDKIMGWLEAEKNISQIYQYSSPGTNHKSQEYALDANGNEIHSAIIEFTTEDNGIISYYDSYGELINLTNSSDYKNGTIVLVDLSDKNNPQYTVTDIGGWPIIILEKP